VLCSSPSGVYKDPMENLVAVDLRDSAPHFDRDRSNSLSWIDPLELFSPGPSYAFNFSTLCMGRYASLSPRGSHEAYSDTSGI
jgi:hypothetical protein